jgi:nicotinate-nucleotide adenylyltransferase
MTEAVGIMGGTFDPIHFGHLAAAEEARIRFSLGRVIFVANGSPPHKKAYAVTPAEQRHEMVVLATASNARFETSRIEVDRPGPSYAVDTVQVGPEAKLYFITGADAILEILTWHEPEELARRCDFIAVTRPGYDAAEMNSSLAECLRNSTHLLHVPGVAVSSTELRTRAAQGLSLRYLTPDPVVGYIESRGLYRGTASAASAEEGRGHSARDTESDVSWGRR